MTREKFISDLSHWNSYLPILWEALENTEGDIIELGIGPGSTEKLNNYSRSNKRSLLSYESSREWYDQYSHLMAQTVWHHITYVGHNWTILHEHWAHLQMLAGGERKIGVLFSDEAPGEMRKYNISMFCNIAQVIVAHDSENDHGYKFSLVEPLFKYVKKFEYKGVGTTAFSNFVDVSLWKV